MSMSWSLLGLLFPCSKFPAESREASSLVAANCSFICLIQPSFFIGIAYLVVFQRLFVPTQPPDRASSKILCSRSASALLIEAGKSRLNPPPFSSRSSAFVDLALDGLVIALRSA